jgi:hemerythrin
MQLFKWSKMHEVFVPEIDAEHRNILRAGSELYKAVMAGAPADHVCTLLRSLLTTAEEHFQHEERLMRDSEFASYEWHKQQHDAVRKRAKEFVRLIDAGEPDARIELLTFLSGWLRDHTAVADRMMGAYIRNWQRRQSSLAS